MAFFYILTLVVLVWSWRNWDKLPPFVQVLVMLNVMIAVLLATWKFLRRPPSNRG